MMEGFGLFPHLLDGQTYNNYFLDLKISLFVMMSSFKEMVGFFGFCNVIFNRPGVAGAVL